MTRTEVERTCGVRGQRQDDYACRAFCFERRFLAAGLIGTFGRGAEPSMRLTAASQAGLSFSATGFVVAGTGMRTSLAPVISGTPE